ncbi:MAG: chromosome segregation protein SMC [Eubacteriales bacterium]|nr:chromosome segregation protein SMC [Eubacteriales bacterium]
MYLKSIEIQGFKSFANKIKFEFHNGITGIVGPNGSGKSNVADAVRWVLGEQRVKQLRGSSMQDVIFAGTQARRPLGSAFVAITLDNSDGALPIEYREVTVARRIYRSGESEYLLNGTVCRLRDVQELFYDTGIGKEGYSIIGQGQIDRILSDKPQDRRSLFDEAAGIVKYKHRKERTQKRLENERENLVRLTDIVGELERQIPSLERQQEKAKIYLRHRESQKRFEINVFLIENEKNTRQLTELAASEKTAEKDLADARERKEALRGRIEALSEKRRDLLEQIESLRSRITDASIVRGRIEGDIKVLEEQIRASRQRAKRLSEQEEILQEDISQRRTQEAALSGQIREAEEALAGIKETWTAAGKALAASSEEVRRLRGKLEETREGILSQMDLRATLKSQLASIETLDAQESARMEQVERELSQISSEQEQTGGLIVSLREDFRKLGEEIRALQEGQKEIEARIAAHKTSLSDADAQLRQAQFSWHREKSKLDALVNLAERYEGYGGSVRRVMQEKQREPGIVGSVAELLTTDRRYETAIEVALGGQLQNIVTRDEETARRLIEILKREKAGRATFLPLSAIRNAGTLAGNRVLGEPGVIGTADTLVRAAEGCEDVARSLLGRTVIVDTFAHAVEASRRSGHGIRMVTLEGEVFAPGGAISGGQYKNTSSLLGRRREIAELKESTERYRLEVARCEKAIEDTKESRNVLRRKLDESKRRLQEQFIAQNTLRIRIQQEEEKQRETAGSEESLRQELRALKERAAGTAAARQKAQQDLEDSFAAEKALGDAAALLQKQLEERQKEEERDAANLSGQELERSRKEQELRFHQQNADRVRQELGHLEAQLSSVREGAREDLAGIEERERRIRSLREEAAASEEARSTEEEALQVLRGENESAQAQQEEAVREQDSTAEVIMGLSRECDRLASRRERLEEAVEQKAAYMWEEYEITPADAAALRDEGLTDLSAMKKEIAQLREQIRALGNVNVSAIEEYRALMERYTFLKGQHDDLTRAAASLEKIILELDEAMRRQFREQFADIQKAFDCVFRELFGGGKGQLELLEDADILEAGVRVIAQPPGKKLQNMMQLSGGEKALTAIALLFAIQSLKPSPFCLLDEIEAALDESNVGRFAQYLHKLTRDTQFIVITHRRGTMEQADRLYGITMQEKGVSTMVSVDLIDQDEMDPGGS